MTLKVDDLPAPTLDWKGTHAKRTPRPGTSPHLARAHALAERLEPSVSGHDGDNSLFKAACELATVLHEDADAIETVLLETYNPRCQPPWPGVKIKREAERAAKREDAPEMRWARRHASFLPEPAPAPVFVTSGDIIDWNAPEQPIDWYCKGLSIAPSERKITIIGGDPGSGKGPLADYLATCFALGLDVFNAFPVKQCNVGILDFEGARLTARRIRSHVRGLGHEPAELTGRLIVRDTEPSEMIEIGWLHDWIAGANIEVLIIDSYMSAMACSDADPNSPEYAALARALGALKIVAIAIAHARKRGADRRGDRPSLGDIAGSYALGGMAATAIAVWNPDDEDRMLCRIGCMRAPDEPFATIDVRWTKGGAEDTPLWIPKLLGTSTRESREARADADLRKANDITLSKHTLKIMRHMALNPATPQSVNAISKSTGIHHRYVGLVLGAMARAGYAYHDADGSGRGAGYYTLDAEHVVSDIMIRDGEAMIAPEPEAGEHLGKFRKPST